MIIHQTKTTDKATVACFVLKEERNKNKWAKHLI